MTSKWNDFQRRSLTVGVAGLAALTFTGAALAAPQQLLNRHITIAWTGTIIEPTDRSPPNLTTASEHVIYVSSSGRLFARSTRSVSSRAAILRSSHDVEPGSAGSRTVRFHGNRVVGNLAMGSGAWQFAVSFSSDYRSCSVNVIYGKNGPTFRWKGLDGSTYEAKTVAVSATRCSVGDGNPFAG
jgi:hypothetical protein